MATKRGVAQGAKSAKSPRGASRGRSARGLFALALVGFVAVASVVILRRVVGVNQQHEIRTLEQKRQALEAERIRLESDIREASSRQRLQPIAEQRLNMHIATPQEIVNLTAPPGPNAAHSRT